MAYLNDNVIAFSPSITLEQGASNLKEITIDASDGDVVKIADDDNAFSKVQVYGVHYSPAGYPYSRKLRINNSNTNYMNSPYLEELYFVAGAQAYEINDFSGCESLRLLSFEDGANFRWVSPMIFTNTAITYIEFGNVADDAEIDIWNSFADDLTLVEWVEIPQGWARDLAFYLSPLHADNIADICQRVAQLEEGETRTLWFGDENILKVDQSIIDIAVNKGWDVF